MNGPRTSGLFRRLAKQASGRATTLHAPARLPFHDAPVATEAYEAPNAAIVAEAPSPIVDMPAHPRSTAPHIAAQIEPFGHAPTISAAAPHASATPERPDHAPTPSAAAPSASAAPAARDSTDPASMIAIRGDDAPRQPASPANPAHADHPVRHAPSSDKTQEMPAPIAPQVATEAPPSRRPAPRTNTPNAKTRVGDDAATPEFPPALLPPRADAERAAPVAASARSQTAERSHVRAQTSAGESPNEVHVHIGRIEVTAIQESAPKPRAKRNGRAPMSLDEYVAKRQWGSS